MKCNPEVFRIDNCDPNLSLVTGLCLEIAKWISLLNTDCLDLHVAWNIQWYSVRASATQLWS